MHASPETLALLALGEAAVPEDERQHLAGCQACQAELGELAELVAIGRSVDAGDVLTAPPHRVWAAIQHEVMSQPESDRSAGVAPPAAKAVPTTPSTPGGPSRGRRAATLALAASVALVAGIGVGVAIDRNRSTRTVLATASLAALPDWPGSTGTATVYRDPDGSRELIVHLTSPEPVAGRRQVWLINSGITSMSALGFITGDEGRWPIPDDLSLTAYPIVDVSDEPRDDPDPLHSGNSVVRGTLHP